MTPTRRATHRAAVLTAALALTATPALAQRQRPTGQPPPAGWQPAEIGARFGYDTNSNGSLLGGHARIPVVPSGIVEIMPSAEVTFLNQTKDYQYSVEAVLVRGGPSGGAYVGGGLGRRSLVLGPGGRETRSTWSIVAGVRGLGLVPFLNTQLELRWIYVADVAFNPQTLAFGVNLPLWRRRGSATAPGGR